MKTSKFKMTEIGEIPADWEVKRLGDIGEPLMCKRILKSQTSEVGDIPFYKIGTFGKVADAYIPYQLFNSFKYQYSYPRKGDILLSAAGTIGRTVVFDGHDSYFQDSNIVWIDNDERIVTNDYLKWFYCVIDWVTEDGGIVTRLYNNNIRNALVSCPPLAEQKAIAEALSDVDALIAAQEELIEKKRAIKQGAMQELLTGKKRLPGFGGKSSRSLRDKKSPTENAEIAEFKQTELGEIPVDWEVKRIGEIFELSAAGDLQFECSSREKTDLNIYPIYSNSIENAGLYGFTSNPRYSADSITITGRGTLGHAEYRAVDFDAIIRLIIMKPLRMVDGRYVTFQINYCSPFHFEITSIPQLTVPQVANSLIPVPPLPEQKKIAEVLSDMDAEIESLEAKRAKYESIKQGMMQELLTGKTRLKGA